MIPGYALALGDRPAGNDEGLTRWHRAHRGGEIPFIAVSEHPALVPEWMADTHVRRLSNDEASAAVLHTLADRLVAMGDAGSRVQLGEEGSVRASRRSDEGRWAADGLDIGQLARDIVREVNQDVALSDEDRISV